MTCIKFYKNKDRIVLVECEGHTGFDVEGFDIVCAALSSIVQTAVLGLMQVACVPVAYKTDDERGYLRVELPKELNSNQERDSQVILKTLLLGASDLYQSFSDYIDLEVLDL